ncbi:MFS transporter [Amycolatopsis sp. cg5]|uniref:MFS transporter n=1 Tax=Amycolatopsis sp. cg5 TaxID=3238802 RepID=UPI003523811A
MLEKPAAVAEPSLFGVRVGMANLGLWTALLTPAIVTLSARISVIDPVNKEASYGLVAGVGAFIAMVANPLFGRLSDRTMSRFGRRRPWITAGALGGGAGLVIVTLAPTIPLILLGWCLTQVSFNAALAALTATVPDVVPEERRGKVSGWIGFAQLGAVVTGGLIVGFVPSLALKIIIPGALGVILLVTFSHYFADRPAAGRSPFSVKEFLSSFWTSPRANPDFAWAWLTRFLVVLGVFGPAGYEIYFLAEKIGLPKAEAESKIGILLMITSIISAGTALLGGWLSDVLDRRKVFVIAAALIMTVSVAFFITADSYTDVLIAHLISGLGTGMFYAVDFALATLVMPKGESSGKELGVFNIANALPQSIGPMFVPLLLAIGDGKNYAAVYTAAAISALLGAILVTRIKSVR